MKIKSNKVKKVGASPFLQQEAAKQRSSNQQLSKYKNSAHTDLSAVAESQYITSMIKSMTERSDWVESDNVTHQVKTLIFDRAMPQFLKLTRLIMRLAVKQ